MSKLIAKEYKCFEDIKQIYLIIHSLPNNYKLLLP